MPQVCVQEMGPEGNAHRIYPFTDGIDVRHQFVVAVDGTDASGVERACGSAAATTGAATSAHADEHAACRLAIHAGRHRLRHVQSPGWPAWRPGVQGAELVDGHGDAKAGLVSADGDGHVQPRPRNRGETRLPRDLSGW